MNILIAGLVLLIVLIAWYVHAHRPPKACASSADCPPGDICPCAGPNLGTCIPASKAGYSYGYAWQGVWMNPTLTGAACPEACAAIATVAGAPNWTWRPGQDLGCTYGTVAAGGCATPVSGASSDPAAARAACHDAGCALPIGDSGGTFCTANAHCPAGSSCGYAACKADADCVNLTGPCKNGKCATGTCSGDGCNNDQDCLPGCCWPGACSDNFPCPNGHKCVGGYMCCGGDGCAPNPAYGCVKGACKGVGIMSLSCGMNGPFVPSDAQTAQLQAVCSGQAAGSHCSVDFGPQGVLGGSCLGSQGDPLSCFPPNICWGVSGKTSLASPKGICQDTCSSVPGLCPK